MDVKLLELINKDLGVELPLELTRKELISLLEEHINDLIGHNFNQLIQALYRVDVSEAKLKSILLENPDQDAGRIIAQLIIERMAEKLRARKESRKSDGSFTDEERW